jgi:carbon monoxide dehydrogenase subunit G
MVVTGQIRVQAPLQRVWEMLLEPETLQACLPGIEKIERLDEKHYAIVFMQKVGPLPLRFKIKATLTKVEAPTHLELEGYREAKGKVGQAAHKVHIDLRETAGNAVEISYTVDANIAGTPLAFGDGIVRAKAKKLEAEFAKVLQEILDKKA